MIVGVDYWAGMDKSHFLNRDAPFLKEAGIRILRLEFGEWSLDNLATLIPEIKSQGFEVLGLLMRKDLVEDINAWESWVFDVVSMLKIKLKCGKFGMNQTGIPVLGRLEIR
jgi:hypothetical protein